MKMILQVNQFKVRPPDPHEVKPPNNWEKVGILTKAENLENIDVKPVGAQIENKNDEDDQLVGEDDHKQIIDETVNNEKALLLDPHTKVAAEDILKVVFSYFLKYGWSLVDIKNSNINNKDHLVGRLTN